MSADKHVQSSPLRGSPWICAPPDRPDARRDVLPPFSLHSVIANQGQAARPDEITLLSSAEAASGDQSLQ